MPAMSFAIASSRNFNRAAEVHKHTDKCTQKNKKKQKKQKKSNKRDTYKEIIITEGMEGIFEPRESELSEVNIPVNNRNKYFCWC